jgi:CheY-like chemotaxis protein
MNRWVNLARELSASGPPTGPSPDADLLGLRMLGVEREAPIAMLLADLLRDLGCDVVGVAVHARDALALIDANPNSIDGAIVDGDLDRGDCGVVLTALRSRSIPFIVASASPQECSEGAGDVPRLEKPYTIGRLGSALRQHIAHRASPTAEVRQLRKHRRGRPGRRSAFRSVASGRTRDG